MKKGKKIVIGVAAVAVVAGGIYAASGAGRGESQTPQIAVTKAETGDVEEIVDATGTVVSDEQKTFYSPVNAQIKSVSFAEGDTVSKGTKLIEFEVKDLERDNQKAELNVQSGQYDYKNSINKSNEAQQKQDSAKAKVSSLEQQVREQQNYLASLRSQLASVQAQAAADAQAQAQAETQAKAEAQAAREAETQRANSEALTTYQNETLPQYQHRMLIIRQIPVIRWLLHSGRQSRAMRMPRRWMKRKQQEVRQRSPARKQRKLMRIRRPASQKCRSIPITAIVRPVILLPMELQRKHRS